MNVSTSTPIFKFATIRNPKDDVTSQPELEIQPTTDLVVSLVDTIESDKTQPEKIQLINQRLNAFIQSPSFFKSNSAVIETFSRSTSFPNSP